MGNDRNTLMGALIAAAIAFVTGAIALGQQESINATAWYIMAGGTVLSFLKDFQAIWTRKQIAKVSGKPMLASVLAVFLCVPMLSGCTATRDAYRAAEGLDETSKVFSEQYYALVREANVLKFSGVLSGAALNDAQDLVRSTRPIILSMADAANAYELVKNAETEAALEAAITRAALAVSDLLDVIQNVRSDSSSREDLPTSAHLIPASI